MANSSVFGRVAPSVVLAVAALSLGGSAESAAPAVETHHDSPPPGVALGMRPSTEELKAAAKVDRFPGKAGTRKGDATTPSDGIPAGDPGVPTLNTHLSPSCTGTGTDGNRVQVIYAVDSGKTDRYATLLPQLQSWVADVDDTFGVSAAKTGGDRRVRWVHNACTPVIAHEVLPAGTLTAGFNSMYTALKGRGYSSPARKYLVFADDASLCGVGQMYNDSTKTTSNANNGSYTMFARVDSQCWPFPAGWHSTPAHELMHMLGGVQNDAPNTTKAAHCRDETDVMCYADGGALGTMLNICASAEHLLDCRNDDYFSTLPPTGSYLATYWNPADSSFLDKFVPVAPAPTVSISGATSLRAGLAGTYTAASSAAGTSFTWTATPAACIPGAKNTAAVVVACPADYTGTVALTVDGAAGGATGRATLPVTLATSPLATMTTSFTASPAAGPKGSLSTLTARLTSAGVPVRGTVTLLQLVRGSYKEVGSAQDTGTDGVHAWSVSPRTTTTYALRIAYSPAGGWTAPAQPTAVVSRG